MGAGEPWRKIYDDKDFIKTSNYLKKKIGAHRRTRLNILMIGHTGSGKSSLINAIFSISRDRMVNKVTTKGDDIPGVGTYHFLRLESDSKDMFDQVCIFDTMGFTSSGNDGITNDDLKAVCEGRIKCNHMFNADNKVSDEETENKPHCVIFVVSAGQMDLLTPEHDTLEKMMSLNKVIPHDVARLAVLTKMDLVCEYINKDIKSIYRSKKAQELVTKTTKALGVNENEVFPVVNFVKELEVDAVKSVPILYAVKFALDFAYDRQEECARGVSKR